MDGNKLDFFERIEKPKHQEFIYLHNNCILCKSTLELQHVVDFQGEYINEEANCPECKLKVRNRSYPLI